MELHEVKKQSVRGVIGYSVRTIGLYVIAIVATGLLSVYLSPADFGVYYIVTALVGVLTFLSDIGLAASLVQKKEEPTTLELRTVFSVQQGLAWGIFLLTVGLTPLWRSFLSLTHEGLWLLYALGFSFVLASLKTIPSILMERKLQFERIVIPQFVEQITFYGIAVVLAKMDYGIMAFTWAILVRGICGVITMYLLQSWPIAYKISWKDLKSLLHFGVKFQLNDLLARLKDDLFIVVLSKFLGATEIGYIGWAKRWSMFPYQMSVSNIIAILFPTFSRLQHEKKALGKAIEKALFFITLLIFPVLVGMSVMAGPLIQLIPHYGKWQPALFSLYWFCINIAFAALANPVINSLNALGEIHKTLKLMVAMTLTTWIVTPMTIYFYGYNSVAAVAALVAGISVYAYVWLKPMVPFKVIESIWRQGLAAMVMGVVLLWQQGLWMRSYGHFGLGLMVGVGVYTTIIGLTGFNKVKTEILNLRN